MSLDVKQAEIRKLEERALRREEALTRSERMLEEDALRFEGFLKENDLKVQEAIRAGEAETKQKNDRVQEIKRINAQMTVIKTELSKTRDRLDDCRRYKTFLDDITDPEFFAAVGDAKRMRSLERREKRRIKGRVRGDGGRHRFGGPGDSRQGARPGGGEAEGSQG